MSETVETGENWGLIGPGHIGRELVRQAGQDYVSYRLGLNPAPSFIVRSGGRITEADGVTPLGPETLADIPDEEFPGVVFVAMPSEEGGATANDYITQILAKGSLVITAEKGSLSDAESYVDLKQKSENFARLGHMATVGGGTRLIEVAKLWCRDPENITEMHVAFNGTLSAIMSLVGPIASSPSTLNQAVEQAVKLEYAEPGSTSPYEVIRSEATGDIPKKAAILFNMLGLGDEVLDFRKLKVELSDKDIRTAYEEAATRRFLVSYYSQKSWGPEDGIIGGFDIVHDDWNIVGGFRNMQRNPFFEDLWRINGPGSGIAIGLGPNESDGRYTMKGDGAGASPTVNAMLDDYMDKANKTYRRAA